MIVSKSTLQGIAQKNNMLPNPLQKISTLITENCLKQLEQIAKNEPLKIETVKTETPKNETSKTQIVKMESKPIIPFTDNLQQKPEDKKSENLSPIAVTKEHEYRKYTPQIPRVKKELCTDENLPHLRPIYSLTYKKKVWEYLQKYTVPQVYKICMGHVSMRALGTWDRQQRKGRPVAKTRTGRGIMSKELEDKLYEWCKVRRFKHLPVQIKDLQTQAVKIAKTLNDPKCKDFRGSKNYLIF